MHTFHIFGFKIIIDLMYETIKIYKKMVLVKRFQTKKGRRLSFFTFRFQSYFEGTYYDEPIDQLDISYLGISYFKLKRKNSQDILIIYLNRPGLLIGKVGRRIDALKEYLKCDIQIVERNIFFGY